MAEVMEGISPLKGQASLHFVHSPLAVRQCLRGGVSGSVHYGPRGSRSDVDSSMCDSPDGRHGGNVGFMAMATDENDRAEYILARPPSPPSRQHGAIMSPGVFSPPQARRSSGALPPLDPHSAAHHPRRSSHSSPFPTQPPRMCGWADASMEMTGAAAASSSKRKLRRGLSFRGTYTEESPCDVTAFPPPTPYKTPFSHDHSQDHPYQGHGVPPTPAEARRASFSGGRGAALPAMPVSHFEEEYEVLGIIGRGSFGEVYHVFGRTDQKEFAVKCTRDPFKALAQKERCLHEVHALAKVSDSDHQGVSHIVRYYHAWIESDRLYIKMDLCSTSLDKQLAAGLVMSDEQLFNFLRQMLLALDLLHTNDLVHLDIKPANIFFKHDSYKLGDFGLVTVVSNAGMGDCVQEGDARYMSPELLVDGLKDLRKCDVFSLGATVYEMRLQRLLPTNGPEWQAIRQGHLLQVSNNPDLMFLLSHMMAADPLSRPCAAQLLEHPRLRSKMEQQLMRKEKEVFILKTELANEVAAKNKARSGITRINTMP